MRASLIIRERIASHMQTQICKYLRHPQQAFARPARPQPHEAIETPIDPLSMDLCTWLDARNGHKPASLLRRVGGGVLIQDGECSSCPCFQPIPIDGEHL